MILEVHEIHEMHEIHEIHEVHEIHEIHEVHKIHEIHVPTEVIGCKNINCSDENHVHAVNKMYDIVSSLLHAGEQITHKNKKKYTHKPGWAEYVDDLYDASRETRGMWMNAGKPRQGPI